MTTEQTQQGTELTTAVLSAHALESLVNYQSADLPLVEVEAGLPRESTPDYYGYHEDCLLYTSPSPRDRTRSRMPSSA